MSATIGPLPNWSDDEKPLLPGSPATLQHAHPVRIAYILTGVLLGITGGLGNALVTANLLSIQGELGLTPVEAAWLPAAYLMVNISANLLLIKFRQQFGLRLYAQIGLSLYAAATLLHLFADSYATALLARGFSGFAGATLSTLATFYALQGFPKAKLGYGLVIGLGSSQLPLPLAWLLSPALLDLGEWQTLYLFEFGLSLCALAAVITLALPHGIRIRVFEARDFLTFALLAPALALVVGVLAQGRTQWWTDQSWIAAALVTAVILFVTAFFFEHHRRNPLIDTGWLGSASTLRFAVGALGIRFLLSEQTYGAVGLLRLLGMGPDQLQPLYAVILLGMLVGTGISALTFNQKAVIPQIIVSVLLIAIGSLLDWNATSLTRPHDMFLSQFLLAAAATMFLGPLLLTGAMGAIKRGPTNIIGIVVLFGVCQSIGGVAGPAVFGTFQQFREHDYSATINAGVDPTSGAVAQRLRLQGQVFGGVMTDPVLRQAQGTAQLAASATREANVRAFNDVFLLNGVLAMLLLSWSLFHAVRLALHARANPPAATGPATGAAAAI